MKPEIHTETRKHIICPGCGATDQFSWGHLADFVGTDRSWGPWSCDHCGTSIKGTVLADGSPEIEVLDEKHTPGWLLVRVKIDVEVHGTDSLYFVLDCAIYAWNADDPDGHMRYHVEQHTCPTNLVPVEAMLFDQDADPHGILEYVEHVPKPADFPESPTYDDWARIFTRLPAAIVDGKATAVDPVALLGPAGGERDAEI